jgi:hypothetical protein
MGDSEKQLTLAKIKTTFMIPQRIYQDYTIFIKKNNLPRLGG